MNDEAPHANRMKRLTSLGVLVAALVPALLLGACLPPAPTAPPPLVTSAQDGSPPPPVSWQTARSVLDNRCVVCHGCFDAPCQLVLSSPEGLERGASKEAVYDGARLLPVEPSRLFVDAQTTSEWRERGFFSVLERPGASQPNLMQLMLQLGAANPLPAGEKLPASISLELERKLTCSTSEDFGDYMK